ncbi:uncharacterized protein LOC128727022 [Anopheles nili]|uniref:uncharacterized protein LOC128727022 n=1 Tax=Anopheles nili TaxID=185578 RepID=UPI00237BE9DF|nr:uncharacterized protein LOC128727022 [Anopheles nili]
MKLLDTAAYLVIFTVTVVACEAEGATKSSVALVEARYDRYYDIFRYWWPWFSDLATVVFIKLKIWIILVAMLVFGDGYYWAKTSGPSIFEKSQWAQTPGGIGWGRRKRRDVRFGPGQNNDMAEFIFDTLDISDEACRKRIVCEMYVEGTRSPEIWRALSNPGFDVFRAYRPKDPSELSLSDCRKRYQCDLADAKGGSSRTQQTNALDDEDWRWPR